MFAIFHEQCSKLISIWGMGNLVPPPQKKKSFPQFAPKNNDKVLNLDYDFSIKNGKDINFCMLHVHFLTFLPA